MYKKFKHTLKYIFLIGILCFCMTACGNADGQSTAGQSETEVIQESLVETPALESESTSVPEISLEPEPESTAESTPKSELAQRQWQVYIQPDMPEPFIEVLKQYEDFMNADVQSVYDDDVCSKLNVTYDEWYLCYELCESLKSILELYAEDATAELEIYSYSLTDLTGDGFPELIMGRDSDFGTDHDYLYVVFYYSETEGIKMMDTTRYFDMSLYEGGIIEYISAGMSYTMTYLQYQEETESWEQAACIIVDWDYQSATKLYYHGVNLADFSDPDNEPMSEEEYREIVERYTAEPVELEWIPLFSGKATEDGAKSQKDEPVTVIAKVNHYYTDESLNSGSEYEYDSSGNLTRRTDYDADGSVDGWSEWEYDSLGNLIRRAQYNADGSNYGTRTEWDYDTEGKLMRCISYDVDGSIVDRYEYEYDGEGNLMQEINKSNNGSTYFRTEYEYDSAGNLTKVTEYYLSHRIESEYITITPQ